jgi:hypothetical protein
MYFCPIFWAWELFSVELEACSGVVAIYHFARIEWGWELYNIPFWWSGQINIEQTYRKGYDKCWPMNTKSFLFNTPKPHGNHHYTS